MPSRVSAYPLPIQNFCSTMEGRFPCRLDRAFCLRAMCRRIVCGRICYIFRDVATEYRRCFYLGGGCSKRCRDVVSFDDGVVAGQVLNVVSLFLGQLRVVHGNLSCRKGYILHTGLFPLWKVCPSNPNLLASIYHYLIATRIFK